ncbi:MAG: hypothetical protein DRN29_06805 [Thermoplasmata archaeon]|nr:MAG: hypothetical protein DRN29_06805 [Thermoplasmata archaeon]
MHKICITIESEKNDVIYRAIKEEKVPRARVKIWKDDALHVEIEASNAANLRAACNSFLKWIDLVYKIGDVLKE